MKIDQFEYNRNSEMLSDTKCISIFGYGSLIWKPEFEFNSRVVGFIQGYKRRFYQSSVTHRGTVESPGRVATIIKDNKSTVWGVSYRIIGEERISKALEHLFGREIQTGGYCNEKILFYPNDITAEPHITNVYVALEDNDLFVGRGGSLEIQAYQIVKAKGFCGRNIEYVAKVADFMENELTKNWEEFDPYLYKLMRLIRAFEKGVRRPSSSIVHTVSKFRFKNDDVGRY